MNRAPEAMRESGTDRDGPRRPLHLCFASPGYDPVYSGAALRFKRYFPGFQERGIQVSVCTATPGPAKAAAAGMEGRWEDVPYGAFLPPENIDGIPVHRVRLPDGGGFRRAASFARGIVKFCREAPDPPDVIQLFTPALAATPWLWHLRRQGIAIVATRSMMPALPHDPITRAMRVTSMRLASRFTTQEVVGSSTMLQAFRDVGIHGRIDVIPHGVDLERFRPATGPREIRAARRQLGLPEQASILLFVGAVTPRKGVHRLLEAWCRLAVDHGDLHLIIAGPRLDRTAPEHAAYHKKLEGLAERSGARDRLHFPGLVSNVEEYLRAADVFVFPSSREGMPNVVNEAMASGLPVVTCPFSGLSSELGRPGEQYILTEFDSNRAAKDIDALLLAPERREELGRNARAWTEAHMNVEGSVDRYAELYSKLACRTQRSPHGR